MDSSAAEPAAVLKNGDEKYDPEENDDEPSDKFFDEFLEFSIDDLGIVDDAEWETDNNKAPPVQTSKLEPTDAKSKVNTHVQKNIDEKKKITAPADAKSQQLIPSARRDPEKTNRDITNYKEKCMQNQKRKLLTERLDSGLVPPGFEMELDLVKDDDLLGDLREKLNEIRSKSQSPDNTDSNTDSNHKISAKDRLGDYVDAKSSRSRQMKTAKYAGTSRDSAGRKRYSPGRRYSKSPRRKSHSPHKRSKSPRIRRSRTPLRRTRSPLRRTRSPLRRTRSPLRRSPIHSKHSTESHRKQSPRTSRDEAKARQNSRERLRLSKERRTSPKLSMERWHSPNSSIERKKFGKEKRRSLSKEVRRSKSREKRWTKRPSPIISPFQRSNWARKTSPLRYRRWSRSRSRDYRYSPDVTRRRRSRTRSPLRKKKSKHSEQTFLEEIAMKLNETRPISYPVPVASYPPLQPLHHDFNTGQEFYLQNTSLNNYSMGVHPPIVHLPPVPQMIPIIPAARQILNVPLVPEPVKEEPVAPVQSTSSIEEESKMAKLYDEKKISLSDYLCISAKPQVTQLLSNIVQSTSADAIKEKLRVVSRCEDALNFLANDASKCTGILNVHPTDPTVLQRVWKHKSPLLKHIQFPATTLPKPVPESQKFPMYMKDMLKYCGIGLMDMNKEELADAPPPPSRKPDPPKCKECDKRKAVKYVHKYVQCDVSEMKSIETQVTEEDLTPKKRSLAAMTPAELLGLQRQEPAPKQRKKQPPPPRRFTQQHRPSMMNPYMQQQLPPHFRRF